KSENTVTLSAAGSGYKPATDSYTIGALAAKLDKATNRISLTIPLEKVSEQQPGGDFIIDVAVTDQKTGAKIAGAKTTFDGETRDAPSGVASYTRNSAMLAPDKRGSSVAPPAAAPRHTTAPPHNNY